jgi:hypothetical protein
MLVVGSQEQELWAWQEGGRKGTTATFCKEGKGLAKALCSQPISPTSERSFHLEAKGHHWPDPSQMSPATGQIPHTKNSPCLEWADWEP